MVEFVVEHYVARSGADRFRRDAEGARRAAEQLTAEGTPVTSLCSIFVPEDETCYVLYRASSADAVREAAQRAELQFERVAEAITQFGSSVKQPHGGAAPGRDEGRAMSHPDDTAGQARLSRRGFLGKVGVGAVAVGASGGLGVGVARAKPQAPARRYAATAQHFGRIFRADAAVRIAGPTTPRGRTGRHRLAWRDPDAKRPTRRSPSDLITDLVAAAHNLDNPTHTAGTTFLGQFLDDDMTSDTASPLGRPAVAGAVARTAVPRRSTSTPCTGAAPAARPSSSTRPTGRSSQSSPAACSRTCPGRRAARPSSAIPETTSTR